MAENDGSSVLGVGDLDAYLEEVSEELAGSQEPTIDRYTDTGLSYSLQVNAVSKVFLGRELLPWQQHVSEVWTMVHEVKGKKKFVHYRCGLSVPRQNGKSALLISIALMEAAVLGRSVLYTAHELKTASEAFRELTAAVALMGDEVISIRRANGQEEIFFANGGRIKVIARTNQSGRGLTFDTIICDEAQSMTEQEDASLSAVVASAPSGDGRLILVGTPPQPGAGEPYRALRNDVLSKRRSPRLSWLEWGAERGDVATDDEELWAEYNPSLGIGRLTIDSLREEAGSPTFIVERLGCWQAAESNRVITLDTWNSLRATEADPRYDLSRGVALGIDISPDSHSAAVVACGTWVDKETGKEHPLVSVMEHKPGVSASDWVPQYVARAGAKLGKSLTAVVIDKASPTGEKIAKELSKRRIKATLLGYGGAKAAFAGFMEHVYSGELRHSMQPSLDVALNIARRRRSGDAFLWKKLAGSDGDITPVVGATHAVYGWEAYATANRKKKNAYRGIRYT